MGNNDNVIGVVGRSGKLEGVGEGIGDEGGWSDEDDDDLLSFFHVCFGQHHHLTPPSAKPFYPIPHPISTCHLH